MLTGCPSPLLSGIRRTIFAAGTMPRVLWLALKAPVQRVVRLVADARREHALRRARYWGTYN